jgi:hypothetical protein
MNAATVEDFGETTYLARICAQCCVNAVDPAHWRTDNENDEEASFLLLLRQSNWTHKSRCSYTRQL